MDRRLCEHRRGAAGHPAAPGDLGFGLLGTVIGITTQQLYTYHWDNHAGWWDTRGWTRETIIALPVIVACMTPEATFLICWRRHRQHRESECLGNQPRSYPARICPVDFIRPSLHGFLDLNSGRIRRESCISQDLCCKVSGSWQSTRRAETASEAMPCRISGKE